VGSVCCFSYFDFMRVSDEECEKGLTVDGRVCDRDDWVMKVAMSGLCIFLCFLQVEDECGVCNSGGIGEWTIAVNIGVMEAHVLSAAFAEWRRQG